MHYPPGKNFDMEKKCSSAYAFVCMLQALIQWELGTIENCERENILSGAQHGNDRARVPRHDFITVFIFARVFCAFSLLISYFLRA